MPDFNLSNKAAKTSTSPATARYSRLARTCAKANGRASAAPAAALVVQHLHGFHDASGSAGSEKVARIGIKAQACTETICKDINKELELDLGLAVGPAEPGMATLSAVRTQ